MGTSLLAGTKSFTVLVCRSSSVILLSADIIDSVSTSLAPVGGSCSRGVVFGSGFGGGFDCVNGGFDCVDGFGFGVGFDCNFDCDAGLRACGVTVAVSGRLDLRDVCIVHPASLPVLMSVFYRLELLKS